MCGTVSNKRREPLPPMATLKKENASVERPARVPVLRFASRCSPALGILLVGALHLLVEALSHSEFVISMQSLSFKIPADDILISMVSRCSERSIACSTPCGAGRADWSVKGLAVINQRSG